jgi:D-alanyl-D-alanine carboxypeptidase
MHRTNVFHTVIAAALLAATVTALAPAAHAQVASAGTDPFAATDSATGPDQASERLMIVNRNTGRVIYDDGRNDLFCVTRVYIAGYNDWGRPIYRRNMRCR